MGVRAVVVDIGGVLERCEPPSALLARWQRRLGTLGEADLRAALAPVDPDGLMETGGLTEAEYQRRYAAALGLTSAQVQPFMRDLWDWYCGELDAEMAAYVASLRPRYATAIVSNSADGARREEQERYGFENLVDTIIYSHEVGIAKPDPRIFALVCERLGVAPGEVVFLDDVPVIVDAAAAFGMQAVLHRGTPASISAISALLPG
jgi:putative hydrolase of the HAD superfamily